MSHYHNYYQIQSYPTEYGLNTDEIGGYKYDYNHKNKLHTKYTNKTLAKREKKTKKLYEYNYIEAPNNSKTFRTYFRPPCTCDLMTVSNRNNISGYNQTELNNYICPICGAENGYFYDNCGQQYNIETTEILDKTLSPNGNQSIYIMPKNKVNLIYRSCTCRRKIYFLTQDNKNLNQNMRSEDFVNIQTNNLKTETISDSVKINTIPNIYSKEKEQIITTNEINININNNESIQNNNISNNEQKKNDNEVVPSDNLNLNEQNKESNQNLDLANNNQGENVNDKIQLNQMEHIGDEDNDNIKEQNMNEDININELNDDKDKEPNMNEEINIDEFNKEKEKIHNINEKNKLNEPNEDKDKVQNINEENNIYDLNKEKENEQNINEENNINELNKDKEKEEKINEENNINELNKEKEMDKNMNDEINLDELNKEKEKEQNINEQISIDEANKEKGKEQNVNEENNFDEHNEDKEKEQNENDIKADEIQNVNLEEKNKVILSDNKDIIDDNKNIIDDINNNDENNLNEINQNEEDQNDYKEKVDDINYNENEEEKDSVDENKLLNSNEKKDIIDNEKEQEGEEINKEKINSNEDNENKEDFNPDENEQNLEYKIKYVKIERDDVPENKLDQNIIDNKNIYLENKKDEENNIHQIDENNININNLDQFENDVKENDDNNINLENSNQKNKNQLEELENEKNGIEDNEFSNEQKQLLNNDNIENQEIVNNDDKEKENSEDKKIEEIQSIENEEHKIDKNFNEEENRNSNRYENKEELDKNKNKDIKDESINQSKNKSKKFIKENENNNIDVDDNNDNNNEKEIYSRAKLDSKRKTSKKQKNLYKNGESKNKNTSGNKYNSNNNDTENNIEEFSGNDNAPSSAAKDKQNKRSVSKSNSKKKYNIPMSGELLFNQKKSKKKNFEPLFSKFELQEFDNLKRFSAIPPEKESIYKKTVEIFPSKYGFEMPYRSQLRQSLYSVNNNSKSVERNYRKKTLSEKKYKSGMKNSEDTSIREFDYIPRSEQFKIKKYGRKYYYMYKSKIKSDNPFVGLSHYAKNTKQRKSLIAKAVEKEGNEFNEIISLEGNIIKKRELNEIELKNLIITLKKFLYDDEEKNLENKESYEFRVNKVSNIIKFMNEENQKIIMEELQKSANDDYSNVLFEILKAKIDDYNEKLTKVYKIDDNSKDGEKDYKRNSSTKKYFIQSIKQGK